MNDVHRSPESSSGIASSADDVLTYNYEHFWLKHFVADRLRTSHGAGLPVSQAPDFDRAHRRRPFPAGRYPRPTGAAPLRQRDLTVHPRRIPRHVTSLGWPSRARSSPCRSPAARCARSSRARRPWFATLLWCLPRPANCRCGRHPFSRNGMAQCPLLARWEGTPTAGVY